MKAVVEITRATIADAPELIAQLNADLERRYPEEGANHVELRQEELDCGRGAFLVARDEIGQALGCGAVRLLEPGVAEIKRLFVSPLARGRRIGTALLEALEEQARALKVHHLVLETGDRQHEAMQLYERLGFQPITRFGPYVDSPLSICMAKDLTSE